MITYVDRDPNIVVGRPVGALPSIRVRCRRSIRPGPPTATLPPFGRTVGNRLVRIILVQRAERDFRRLGWIGRENLAGLEPPLVGPQLARVEDVAGADRKPVVDRAGVRVRAVAEDVDVDLADAIAASFLDRVD